MMIPLLFLTLGFILLIKGADWFVDGSASVAKRFRLSPFLIGLTIVALGTSAPELFINIFASLNQKPDIALGNILGSNIANLLFILGISATLAPLTIKPRIVRGELLLSAFAIVIVVLLAIPERFSPSSYLLTRVDGLLLIVFFLFFLFRLFSHQEGSEGSTSVLRTFSIPASLLRIGGGLTGLILGGHWIVQNAVLLASSFRLSEAVIALTIVALGTSLPELATSAMAAYKHQPDIAIGNIIGSNIFNLFWVLGVSALIHPLPLSAPFLIDSAVLFVASILLFVFLWIGKRHVLQRWQGIALVLIYIFYIISLILR